MGTSRSGSALALGALLLGLAAPAAADPPATSPTAAGSPRTAAVAPPAAPPVESAEPPSSPDLAAGRRGNRDHAVFVEAFGRGGLWGLGYAWQLGPRFGLGAVASASAPDGQRLLAFAPYVTVYPLAGRRHRWFVDAGPQLAHLSTPSPVPEWDGTSSTGVGAHLATGYELRARVLVRVFGMVVAGEHGVSPWFGADVGWTL